jgi:glutamate/aspartate transport system permease protein
MNYNWNWSIFWDASPEGGGTYFDLLLSGLWFTIFVSLFAWVIALALGWTVGVMRTLPSKWAQGFASAYIELFRNIPLIVQLFLWYFVMPELLPVQWGTWLKQLPNAPVYTAIFGLALFTSSRVAVQTWSGIASLPRGQLMAARALGLNLFQSYRYVILPRALRVVLPPLTSEFLNLIKNSSVALTIGLLELTARARSMQEYSFQVFEAFTAATLLYLFINFFVVTGMRWIERRAAIPGMIAER